MSARCSNSSCNADSSCGGESSYRWVLWVALSVNAAMFVVEMVAGVLADSSSPQADAMDFLADAANYGISLGVLGLALRWRTRAALIKGISMGLVGIWVVTNTLRHAFSATVPEAPLMGSIGALALLANVGVAVLLYRWRSGDANMRSVWIGSRNDAIGNVAVLLAALGVLGTGAGWPDIVVAAILASLALWGAAQIVRQAGHELRAERTASASGHGSLTSTP